MSYTIFPFFQKIAQARLRTRDRLFSLSQAVQTTRLLRPLIFPYFNDVWINKLAHVVFPFQARLVVVENHPSVDLFVLD